MARKILNLLLPGGLLSPLTGTDELTAAEETLIANLQAGTFANETPSGAVNGSNTTFTLAATPSPAGSLNFYINGQMQSASGEDYTLTNNSISVNISPEAGDVLRAFYLVDTDT